MTKRLSLLSLLFILIGCSGNKDADLNYLPQTPNSSSSVCSYDLYGKSADEQLAVLSLQGIANRNEARIYTYSSGHNGVMHLEMYKKKGYITEDEVFEDAYELIYRFRNCIKGIVVTDPGCGPTINLASNIAGVMDLVIASPENVDRIKTATGKDVIYDLQDFGFKGQYDTFMWYKQNIFPMQRHDVLALAPDKGYRDGHFLWDMYRDYLIEFKIPTFWLPGHNDTDYDPRYEEEIINLFKETPTNIPILGFWPYNPQEGFQEFDGVKLAGQYGKFTLVNTHSGNYSYHSGVKCHNGGIFRQQGKTDKEPIKYEKDKKYVALIMNESGDAPCYFMYVGFYPRQWNDPQRGEVPISYGISPSIRMLIPAILEDIYDSATPNDYFYTSISGAGYCYPFEGYGSLTPDPDGTLRDYYHRLTAGNMKLMDHEMLGIYTHSGGGWSENDRRIMNEIICSTPGTNSVISGMHRTAILGPAANEMCGNASIHHTVTFWSYDDLIWDDTSLDEKAAGHLENEIRQYGADSQFIQAMFYSWHYGPRRLSLLKERLEKDGYVFVTLDDFDDLYRQSLNI